MSMKFWNVFITVLGAIGGFVVGTVLGGLGLSLAPWVEGCDHWACSVQPSTSAYRGSA